MAWRLKGESIIVYFRSGSFRLSGKDADTFCWALICLFGLLALVGVRLLFEPMPESAAPPEPEPGSGRME